jgi:hypothetical protein
MHRVRSTPTLLTVLMMLIVTACTGSASSPGVGRPSAPPPTVRPTAFAIASGSTAAATTLPARPSFAFTWPGGSTPAVTPALAGIDAKYVNPGAIIESGGILHMYANVFSTWPGQMEIVHLTSPDGVTWSADKGGPVLSSKDVPFADPGMDVSTGFVALDGTWVLVIESVSVINPWVIGRATAPGPDGPWTVEREPILRPGEAGTPDAGGVAWPSVVPTDDGFAMYYTSYQRARGAGVIDLATSRDGMTWSKRPGSVLMAAATWEHGKVDRPRVARTSAGLLMVYSGAVLTDRGAAWSQDGIMWQRDGEEPVISKADFPTGTNAWDAALVARDGAVDYFLEIGATNATKVYRATAPLP